MARLNVVANSLGLQRGFSLIESVAAVGLIAIAVVGSVVLLGATVRTSANTQDDLSLIGLVRVQVETIRNAPYNNDAGQYPLIESVPPNVSVIFEATDPGARYRIDGTDLGQVIQQIKVTATKDGRSASMTFLKIKTAGLPTPTPAPTATPTPIPPPTDAPVPTPSTGATPVPSVTPTPTLAPTPPTDTLEFDTMKGKTPGIIPIAGDVYAVAYAGEGDDGFLKTVTIAASGQITDAVIDTLEFDTLNGETPDIVQISGDVYAIAYAGDRADGFLKTVTIAASGQITDVVIDTLEFDTLNGETPDIVQVSGDVYAIAYAGDRNDGFLKTVTIAANGQITDAVIDTLEFDTRNGRTPDIIRISGGIYAIAYAGDKNDGFLKTVEIAANGQITDAVIDTLEFDTLNGETPDIIQVSGDVYAITYTGDRNDGFLKTVEIAANGQITDAVIDTLEFDTLKGGAPNIVRISGGIYAIAYTGDRDDGFLKTVVIAADGQITDAAIDTLEFDTLNGETPNIIPISGDLYAIAYAGDADDGFLKTVVITASGDIQE